VSSDQWKYYDRRVAAMLRSSGGTLVRELLYFIKLAAVVKLKPRLGLLQTDLAEWNNGTLIVQKRWMESYRSLKKREIEVEESDTEENMEKDNIE
jgi:hypothetical protein